MDNDVAQTIKRYYKRAIILASVLAVVLLVSVGLFAFQVYQNPNKVTFSLTAILLVAFALTYWFGFHLRVKRQNARFGLSRSKASNRENTLAL